MSERECHYGYTTWELEEMLGERIDEFYKWMHGQTRMICMGTQYNHDTEQYDPAPGHKNGYGHGVIVYTWDYDRFLAGHPVVD